MFYFRENELAKLHDFCHEPNHKAMAIYGRRRIGKTELVLHFSSQEESLPCIYFQCASFDYTTCLKDFVAVLQNTLGADPILESLSSFKDVFVYLERTHTEPLIVFIDEFPFLCRKREDAIVEYQWIIDHALNHIRIVLLGSNLSFMRKQLGDTESPLYGRFDEIMEIRPFHFSEIQQLFPAFEEAVSVYAMTGGIAQYVMFFLNYRNPAEATDHLFFNKSGRLLQETDNLLLQEVRDTSTYASILRAIAGSEKDSGQIAARAGLDPRGIFAYLSRLMDLEIVTSADNPLSSKKRETRYKISDMLFRFHYTFIEPNLSMINSLGPKSSKYILGAHYQEYLGIVYEEIIRSRCFEYAESGRIPFMPQTIGKWWGNISIKGSWQESEIDIVAYDQTHLLAGECKYRTKAIGVNELDLLQAKAGFLPAKGRTLTYLLASRSGFTPALRARAEADPTNIILIDQI